MGKVHFFSRLGSAGMTLAELLVGLAVVALSVAAVAGYAQFLNADYRIQSTSAQLLQDLQRTRRAAMTPRADEPERHLRGAGIRFESSRGYRLFSFNDRNLNSCYDGVAEEEAFPREGQRAFSFPVLKIHRGAGLEEPVNTVLLFDHSGLPRSGDMDFQKLSIVVQDTRMSDWQGRCVTVHMGRLREGRWEAGACREG